LAHIKYQEADGYLANGTGVSGNKAERAAVVERDGFMVGVVERLYDITHLVRPSPFGALNSL
jgi:hypothetical protein